MSDLTNIPEPSYGKAARRFNAEAALGRVVLVVLNMEMPAGFGASDKIDAIRATARSLGLLFVKCAGCGQRMTDDPGAYYHRADCERRAALARGDQAAADRAAYVGD